MFSSGEQRTGNMIIHPRTIEQNVEESLLTFINCALKDALHFGNSKELAEYILHPNFVGEMTLQDIHSGEKEESSVGLNFLSLGDKRYKRTTFKGLILDKNGIGIIDGVYRIVNDLKYRAFIRNDVTIFGLSKKESVYNCSTRPNSGIYEGTIITHTSSGKIKFYPDDISKIFIHQDLNEYYLNLMKQDFMKEEH